MGERIYVDELEKGDQLTVVVSRRSRNNGIIETGHSHINIGEVSKEAVGEKIEIEILGVGGYAIARCLNEEYTSNDYSPEEMLPIKRESIPPDRSSSNWEDRKGETMGDLPDRM